MKTHTEPANPVRRLPVIALLSLAGAALAAPALAHPDGDGDADDYRPRMARPYAHSYAYRPEYRPARRYAWLNRINRYGVRGRIVAWGRGPLRGCFRVKRTGRYRGDAAIVTVRYCLDGYGQAYGVRGSKRLVRYLEPYHRVDGYRYYRPMRRY